MTRTYYAARYPYGVATDTTSGRLIRTTHQFRSVADRDAWVADRPTDYRTTAGYRAVVRRSELTASERDILAAEPWTSANGAPWIAQIERER